MFKKDKDTPTWTSRKTEEKQSPWKKIKTAAMPNIEKVQEQFNGLFGTRRRLSEAVISAGEIIGDAAQSSVGRVVVSTVALTGAWILL